MYQDPELKVYVVVPLFNESKHIRETSKKIRSFLPTNHHLVFVDDGSVDSSWEVLKTIEADFSHATSILRLSRNFGKEDAICAGLAKVLQIYRSHDSRGPKCAIVMDADLQHPPQLIPEMIELWKAGFKIVEARKENERKSYPHQFFTRIYLQIFKSMTSVDLEGASDFKLLDIQALQAWETLGENNPFFRGIVAWMGFKKTTITFKPAIRTQGTSKWSFLSLLNLGTSSIINFSSLPLQIITFTGAVFFVFSILLGVQALYRKIGGTAVDGFTTVILLLLIIGWLIMFSLGMIGTYLGKIHQEIKRRPRYFIEEEN